MLTVVEECLLSWLGTLPEAEQQAVLHWLKTGDLSLARRLGFEHQLCDFFEIPLVERQNDLPLQ